VLLQGTVAAVFGALGHWGTDTVLPSRVQETNLRKPKPKTQKGVAHIFSSSAAGQDEKIDRETYGKLMGFVPVVQ
jgi:hypothetical protein